LIQPTEPHRDVVLVELDARRVGVRVYLDDAALGVALQVAFERQILKPVFHLIGYRLWV
jgi:hypothetical protein